MLNIVTKADIIIPFDNIGDNDWLDNTKKIIDAITDNWNEDIAMAIADDKITQLEKRLNIALPTDLAMFYKQFGIANIGEILLNIDEVDWLQNVWQGIEEMLADFSEQEKIILPNLIAFSECLGGGNMMCFHSKTHEVFFFNHENKPYLSKLFTNVSDYIKACLIYYQLDLFDINIGKNKVETWCYEILVENFPIETIKKWLF